MNKAEKAALRAQARADFLDGMSYREIADKYGVGIGSVARWAAKDEWSLTERDMTAMRNERSGTGSEQKPERRRKAEQRPRAEQREEDEERLADVIAPEPGEVKVDFDLLRESALLALERINQRLRSEKPLEPRDIKSITGALLDLKNQLNALSPRELREMALRLRNLEKQNETVQAEPVVVKFVNREWEDAND